MGTRFFVDDFAAEVDALVADVDGARPSDEASNLVLVLAAERAVILHTVSAITGQSVPSPS